MQLKDLDNRGALSYLLDTIHRLREAGFVINGSIALSKPMQFRRGDILRYDSPDGKFSQCRFVISPANPIPSVSDDISVDNRMEIPPNMESSVTLVPIANSETPIPGLVRDGSICTNCGGLDFERRGTCLYCVGCGSSVSGCS
jgi:hypothetical protein